MIRMRNDMRLSCMVDIAPASVWHSMSVIYMSFSVWRPGVDDYGRPWRMGDYLMFRAALTASGISVYISFTYGGHFCNSGEVILVGSTYTPLSRIPALQSHKPI